MFRALFSLFSQKALFSRKPDPQPGPRPPLVGLDAIGHLHEQARGDFFLMNRMGGRKEAVPPPAPDLSAEPYEGPCGHIFIPAVPVDTLAPGLTLRNRLP